MCKLALKDAYFSVPLEKNSRQFICFCWSRNLYKFLCLCFGLEPAPQIFTKLLKVPMTILHRINNKIIIYLDNMLLICHSLEEILINQDTVIFLLQHLGFVINCKNSALTPVQEIEFLGLTRNSATTELSLNKTKIQKVVSEYQNLLNNPQTSILELTRLIGCWHQLFKQFYQQGWIVVSSKGNKYIFQKKIVLNENSKTKLKWWV